MQNQTSTCEHCKTSVPETAAKCASCGFPVGGTDIQKDAFYHQLEAKKGTIKDLHNKVYNARITLWIIAGLNVFFGIVNYYMIREHDGAIIFLLLNVVTSIIYLLLASYAIEKPFTALVMAAVVYVAFIIYWTAEGIVPGLWGWFGRAAIIAFLIKGAVSARDAEELKKEIK